MSAGNSFPCPPLLSSSSTRPLVGPLAFARPQTQQLPSPFPSDAVPSPSPASLPMCHGTPKCHSTSTNEPTDAFGQLLSPFSSSFSSSLSASPAFHSPSVDSLRQPGPFSPSSLFPAVQLCAQLPTSFPHICSQNSRW